MDLLGILTGLAFGLLLLLLVIAGLVIDIVVAFIARAKKEVDTGSQHTLKSDLSNKSEHEHENGHENEDRTSR